MSGISSLTSAVVSPAQSSDPEPLVKADAQSISLKEFKQGYLNITVPAKGLKGEELFIYINNPELLNKKVKAGFKIERIGFTFEKIMDGVKPKREKGCYIDLKSYLITNLGMEIHDDSGKVIKRIKPDTISTSKFVESVMIIGKEPVNY